MFFAGTALEALTHSQREAALKRGRLVTIKSKKLLNDEVPMESYWALLVKGVLRVESYATGEGEHSGFLTKGDMITEGPIVMGDYPLRVRAVLDADLFLLPRPDMLTALAENPAFALGVIQYQAGVVLRLFRSISRVNSVSTEQAVGRILFELSVLSDEGARVVDRRITQKDIADALGLSREQVNKVLKMLEHQGLVSKNTEGYVVGERFATSQVLPLTPADADKLLAEEAARWKASRKKENEEIAAERQGQRVPGAGRGGVGERKSQ